MFAHDNISTPIPFNADVSDDVALAEGDEAADRIISGATVVDHLKIGRALMVGSRIAAREAGCDRGKPYNIAFGNWLKQHPKLRAVNEQNRAAALWCLAPENWPRVEKYLAALDINERQTITLRTVRRKIGAPPRPATPKAAPAPAPKVMPQAETIRSADAPKADPSIAAAADRAEVATLRAEVWALRDRLAQLAIFLGDEVLPNAENRPFVRNRAWPLWPMEKRPKDAPPKRIVNPPANDPAFALRKEEFEQWLVRRRETLEQEFIDRKAELEKGFEAKVKARVEAEMAKVDKRGRALTNAEWLNLATFFHVDRRKHMTEQDWNRAFSEFMSVRDRVVVKDKTKAAKAAAPEPPPEPTP